MPYPKTPMEIQMIVWELTENKRNLSAKALRKRLAKRMTEEEIPLEQLPSERTVGRIKREFWDEKVTPSTKRRQVRYVSWPESFVAGVLPWEAAPVCMELLNWYQAHPVHIAVIPGSAGRGNPPMEETAVWFWRVTLAAPGLDLANRLMLAKHCEFPELTQDPDETERTFRAVESYLQMAPWKSPAHEKKYQKAIVSQEIFGLPTRPDPPKRATRKTRKDTHQS
jgi:hypothetical protein